MTTKFDDVPGQVPAVGVTTYVTVPADVPELVMPASDILPVPDTSKPVIVPAEAEAVHVNVAPETLEVGANVAVPPVQMFCVNVLFVIVATGWTVTTKFDGVPGHVPTIGVTT